MRLSSDNLYILCTCSSTHEALASLDDDGRWLLYLTNALMGARGRDFVV